MEKKNKEKKKKKKKIRQIVIQKIKYIKSIFI